MCLPLLYIFIYPKHVSLLFVVHFDTHGTNVFPLPVGTLQSLQVLKFPIKTLWSYLSFSLFSSSQVNMATEMINWSQPLATQSAIIESTPKKRNWYRYRKQSPRKEKIAKYLDSIFAAKREISPSQSNSQERETSRSRYFGQIISREKENFRREKSNFGQISQSQVIPRKGELSIVSFSTFSEKVFIAIFGRPGSFQIRSQRRSLGRTPRSISNI